MLIKLVLAVAIAAAAAERCDDTCPFAKNGVCEDGRQADDDLVSRSESPPICALGTDCSDCAAPENLLCDNACPFSNDGKCDDGRDGGEALCALGSDCGDCGPILLFGEDWVNVGGYSYHYFDDDINLYLDESWYYDDGWWESTEPYYDYYYNEDPGFALQVEIVEEITVEETIVYAEDDEEEEERGTVSFLFGFGAGAVVVLLVWAIVRKCRGRGDDMASRIDNPKLRVPLLV